MKRAQVLEKEEGFPQVKEVSQIAAPSENIPVNQDLSAVFQSSVADVSLAQVREKEEDLPQVEDVSQREAPSKSIPVNQDLPAVFGSPVADVSLAEKENPPGNRRVSDTSTVNSLKKIIENQKEDPFADLKYLNEMMAETAVFSPLMRAIIYKPGEGASTTEKETAFRYLLKTAIETSVKLISLTTRGLKITEEEKRSAVKKALPWVGELVANNWVVLPEGENSLDLDSILRSIRSTRPEVDKLLKKARVPEDMKIDSADMASVQIRTAISQALYPVVNMLALYEESQDPKQIGDLIESYKDYLVKDSIKFLDSVSSDQMKIGESTKIDALASRLKQVSTLLTSDLQSYKALAGRNPTKEELIKNRLPRVRGLVYQIDTFVQSAIGGIRISRATDLDVKPSDVADLESPAAEEGGVASHDVVSESPEPAASEMKNENQVKTKQQSRTFGATL